MKKLALIFTLVCIGYWAPAKSLNALFSYTTFDSPENKPYIETYLSVKGSSLNYLKIDENKFQGAIEVIILFKQNEEIISYDKYEVKSPVVTDTGQINYNILDQQRYALRNGSYNFEIWLSDQNSSKKPFVHTEVVNISYPEDEVSVSGIELLASYKKSDEQNMYTKNGFELMPLVSNYYPKTSNELIFYTEVYNTDQVFGENGKFLIDYYIESFETAKKITDYQVIRRQDAGMVVPLIGKFDIEFLPSGNYKLVVEARNRENELVAINKVFFQRSNPDVQFDVSDLAAINIQNTFVEKISSKDTLSEYIKCLAPISSEIERQFANKQLFESDLATMQQFFLNFWLTRDNLDPYSAWLDYYTEVRKVDNAYATQVKEGYETDRGRVYLKYGPPNIVSESYNEPSAYPYEIWHYYVLGNQRNKKFVFMSQDIVTNDFELIHSDAIGELSNYRWQVLLHRRDFDPTNVDITAPPDAWGNQAEKYYTEPF
ncbi:MAG: GWxTD domain-containing protein [Bacteroidales bacterium]|nr:GWxTD domain-containing protein [Bacteroidales bacterium]MCF8388768.1 GWxTD domain-containing protein [Bacteroidales bacterium]MCF8396866.1 GWxTD domain-containing protein [Bacteroidales bacterium]